MAERNKPKEATAERASTDPEATVHHRIVAAVLASLVLAIGWYGAALGSFYLGLADRPPFYPVLSSDPVSEWLSLAGRLQLLLFMLATFLGLQHEGEVHLWAASIGILVGALAVPVLIGAAFWRGRLGKVCRIMLFVLVLYVACSGYLSIAVHEFAKAVSLPPGPPFWPASLIGVLQSDSFALWMLGAYPLIWDIGRGNDFRLLVPYALMLSLLLLHVLWTMKVGIMRLRRARRGPSQ